jgi:MFS family permease
VRALAGYPFRLGPVGGLGAPDEAGPGSTPFGGLAVVNYISSSGDTLVAVALAGSVFVSVSLGAARSRTAIGLLCTVLPFAVVGPLVGPAIDRVRGGRKWVVFAAAIGRMVACLLMSSWIHSLLLFPAAFASLVCSKTHAVAKASLVPAVVDESQDLVRANARLAVGSAVASAVAAGFGSLVYAVFRSRAVLDADVVVFGVAAALSLHLLRGTTDLRAAAGPPAAAGRAGRSERRVAPAPTRRARPGVPREVGLAQVPMAGMRAVAGFMTALVVFSFRSSGAPIIWYGLVGIASIGGNMAGAFVAPWLRDHVVEKRLVAGAAALIVATAVAATQMPGLHRRPAALVLAAVVGFAASVAKAAFDATVQRDTADASRSRLFARFESIFQLVWVAGALVPTLVHVTLLPGFVLVAFTVAATSGLFVTGLARERRTGART